MKTNIHSRSYFRGYLPKLEGVREQKCLGNRARDFYTPFGRTSYFKGLILTFNHISSLIKKFHIALRQSLPSSTARMMPHGKVVPTLGCLAYSVQGSLLIPYNRRALLSTKRSRTWWQSTLRTPAGEQGTLPNYSLVSWPERAEELNQG